MTISQAIVGRMGASAVPQLVHAKRTRAVGALWVIFWGSAQISQVWRDQIEDFFTTIACMAVLGNQENARIYIGVTAAWLAVLFPMLQDSVWSDLRAWADA